MMQSGWKLSAWIPASKTARRHGGLERLLFRQLTLDVFDQNVILSNDEHLAIVSSSSSPKGIPCSLRNLIRLLAGNPAILRTGNAVTLESTRIKPLTHGPRGDLTDLCDLSCCIYLHLQALRIRSLGLQRLLRLARQPFRSVWRPLLAVRRPLALLLAGRGSIGLPQTSGSGLILFRL